jgi:hypothetical protein
MVDDNQRLARSPQTLSCVLFMTSKVVLHTRAQAQKRPVDDPWWNGTIKAYDHCLGQVRMHPSQCSVLVTTSRTHSSICGLSSNCLGLPFQAD